MMIACGAALFAAPPPSCVTESARDLDDVAALFVLPHALAVAGLAAQQDDLVLLQVLALIGEDAREHRAGGRAGHVLNVEEGHRLAALLGGERLDAGTYANQR